MEKQETVPVVTLATLADGAAAELFQSELDRVLRNIADVNTDAKQKRTITLTVTFAPDEERELGHVTVKAAAKLAGLKGAKTNVYFGRHQGQLVATEYNPKQSGLFDERTVLRDATPKGA
jgi:hypothetical protein